MTESNCGGCIDYERYHLTCQKDNRDGNCPCTLCIVKSMCKEYCDDYFEWIRYDRTKL